MSFFDGGCHFDDGVWACTCRVALGVACPVGVNGAGAPEQELIMTDGIH
jgi:hypothetical protein